MNKDMVEALMQRDDLTEELMNQYQDSFNIYIANEYTNAMVELEKKIFALEEQLKQNVANNNLYIQERRKKMSFEEAVNFDRSVNSSPFTYFDENNEERSVSYIGDEENNKLREQITNLRKEHDELFENRRAELARWNKKKRDVRISKINKDSLVDYAAKFFTYYDTATTQGYNISGLTDDEIINLFNNVKAKDQKRYAETIEKMMKGGREVQIPDSRKVKTQSNENGQPEAPEENNEMENPNPNQQQEDANAIEEPEDQKTNDDLEEDNPIYNPDNYRDELLFPTNNNAFNSMPNAINKIVMEAKKKMSEEAQKAFDETLKTSKIVYTANMDTVSISNKYKNLKATNKISRKKKYGLDKLISRGKSAIKYPFVFVSHIANKLIKKTNTISDVNSEVFSEFRNAIRNLNDEEKQWIFNHMNSMDALNVNMTPVMAQILTDEIKVWQEERINKYKVTYYKMLDELFQLGNDYLNGKDVDLKYAAERILIAEQIKNSIATHAQSSSIGRMTDVFTDLTSKMSLPGQALAKQLEFNSEISAAADKLHEEILKDAKQDKDAVALLKFLRYNAEAYKDVQIKSNVMGEKFAGGQYYTTDIGELSHEKNTFVRDCVRLASLIAMAGTNIWNIHEKAAQIREISETNAEALQQFEDLRNNLTERYEAIKNNAVGINKNLSEIQNGYISSVESTISTTSEVAGQAAAANGTGYELSFGGDYSAYDSTMHSIWENTNSLLDPLKDISDLSEMGPTLANSAQQFQNNFQAIIDMFKVNPNLSASEVERLRLFEDVVNSFPTTENALMESATATQNIMETCDMCVQTLNEFNLPTTDIVLNYIPEVVNLAAMVGLYGSARERERIQDISMNFDDEMKKRFENIDPEQLKEMIEQTETAELSSGRTR